MTISKSTNYSILALMVTAGFMVGFVLASMMRMAPPMAAVGEPRREEESRKTLALIPDVSTTDSSPSVSDDEKETKQEEATTTSKKSSLVEVAQAKEVQQQEPQSTIDTTTSTTTTTTTSTSTTTATNEHHHYQQFPSDMDRVNALFAKMEATKQVQLEPTEESFHLAVTRDKFAKRIAGEVALKSGKQNANSSHYFYAIPDLDPSMGGVALFTNAFIVGDPPVIFDGNIVYHQESCGPPLPRTYYDTIMRRVTRSETGVGPIKIEPTSNTANQQQADDSSLDILATTWHGDCYYHAIMESLPRLTYVQDFVTQHKEKVRIWTRPGNCLDGDRPNQIWNPAFFSTTATTIAETTDTASAPWWGGHIPRQVLFAKRLLVPTSSHCFLQPEPGKVLQRIMHRYFSGTASAPPPPIRSIAQQNNQRPMILLQHRTGSRSILNAAALRQGLIDAFQDCCDVQDFYPPDDATTLADYAALHNAATIVVGPHGSGLANILFCNPSRIKGMVEIHPKFYNHRMDKNDCHQKSAERLGIPTVMLMAPDGDWFQPFTANIDEVVEQVQKMLAAAADAKQ